MEILQSGSHLDRMIRQTRAHHVELSTMADTKANILLSVASVIVALSFGKLDDPLFGPPAMVLIGFSLVTIILAVYAVMPKLPPQTPSDAKACLKDPQFNLLFFGDFIRLDYKNFQDAMETVLNDTSLTYEVQVREVYNLGKFLAAKKYRYVGLAYVSFMAGLIGATLTLIIMMGIH